MTQRTKVFPSEWNDAATGRVSPPRVSAHTTAKSAVDSLRTIYHYRHITYYLSLIHKIPVSVITKYL